MNSPGKPNLVIVEGGQEREIEVEQQRLLAEAFEHQAQQIKTVRLAMSSFMAWDVLSLVQLSLRHPQLPEQARSSGLALCKALLKLIAPDGILRETAMDGFLPEDRAFFEEE